MDRCRKGLLSQSLQPGKEHAQQPREAPTHVHGEDLRLCTKITAQLTEKQGAQLCFHPNHSQVWIQ